VGSIKQQSGVESADLCNDLVPEEKRDGEGKI
jgi:hypothetical protein